MRLFQPLPGSILGYCAILLAFTCSLSAATESYIVMEAHSGKVFLAKDSEQKRPVASLVKVASAKVVLDWASAAKVSLATQAVVPASAFATPAYNPMSLQPGDRISLRDGLYAMMMGSDGIAARTLADHVGRSILAHRRQTGDPARTFIVEMNLLARSLGMTRTKFVSVDGAQTQKTGLFSRGGYSCASDMARLAVGSMRDEGFKFYVKQKTRSVQILKNNGRNISFRVTNTNQLLGKSQINGVKTGSSVTAGQCVMLNAVRKPLVNKLADGRSQVRSRELVVVVLGSRDRFNRASQLISQAWPQYDQWAASGFPLTRGGRELILVPRLMR